jgi:hypothetical protein
MTVIEKLRRDFNIAILLYIMIELLSILLFARISTLYAHVLTESLIILIIGSIGFSHFMIKRINNHYQRIKDMRFRVISLDHKLNYPAHFKKRFILPLFVFDKSYLHQKRLIPKRFIGFVEGKVAYPIKEISEIVVNNHYQILYIYHGYAALIQDMNYKKFVVHLQNLEPIE